MEGTATSVHNDYRVFSCSRRVSGQVLKYRNGFLIHERYETRLADSSQFALKPPIVRNRPEGGARIIAD